MVNKENPPPNEMPSESRYRIAAVAHAVKILRAFSSQAPYRDAGEIGADLNIPETQVHRALATLESYGLARSVEEKWGLGFGWLHLADVQQRQIDLRQVALPIMRRIRDASDETVILVECVDTRRVNVDYVESTQLSRRVRQHGLDIPLHVGAAGRVLMSGMSKRELDQYFAKAEFVDHAAGNPMSKRGFLRDLNKVRTDGYALTIAEVTSDTAAIAAPVKNHRNDVVAALTISLPRDRLSHELEKACIEQVLVGADELSRLLGHDEYLPG